MCRDRSPYELSFVRIGLVWRNFRFVVRSLLFRCHITGTLNIVIYERNDAVIACQQAVAPNENGAFRTRPI